MDWGHKTPKQGLCCPVTGSAAQTHGAAQRAHGAFIAAAPAQLPQTCLEQSLLWSQDSANSIPRALPRAGVQVPTPEAAWIQGSRFSSATKPGCGCTGAICSSGTVPCHAVLWEPCQSSRTLLEHPHWNRALSAATDAICSPGEKKRAQMPAAFPGSGDEPCRVGLWVLGLWGQLGGCQGSGGGHLARPPPSWGDGCPVGSQQGHGSCRAGVALGSLGLSSVPLCLLESERICHQGADESRGQPARPPPSTPCPAGGLLTAHGHCRRPGRL